MSYYSSISAQPSNAYTWRRNQNTVKFRFGAGLGPISQAIIVVMILSVLGLIYLTQITKTSAYGYQINDLKTQQDDLLSKKRDLEVENARLQALERVQQSNVAQALTTPASTDYVQ